MDFLSSPWLGFTLAALWLSVASALGLVRDWLRTVMCVLMAVVPFFKMGLKLRFPLWLDLACLAAIAALLIASLVRGYTTGRPDATR